MTRLRKKYGNEWFGLPRKAKGKSTEFQNEIRGLSSIIWYSTECNWFEYKSGSALHYFRFPISYQGIAKDGVPVFFEKEGPRTMCPQPPTYDERARAVLRAKIGKVVKRGFFLVLAFE